MLASNSFPTLNAEFGLHLSCHENPSEDPKKELQSSRRNYEESLFQNASRTVHRIKTRTP